MIFIYFDLKVWLVQIVCGGDQKSGGGAEPQLTPVWLHHYLHPIIYSVYCKALAIT